MDEAGPKITIAGFLSPDTIVCLYGTFEDVPDGAAFCEDFPAVWLDGLSLETARRRPEASEPPGHRALSREFR